MLRRGRMHTAINRNLKEMLIWVGDLSSVGGDVRGLRMGGRVGRGFNCVNDWPKEWEGKMLMGESGPPLLFEEGASDAEDWDAGDGDDIQE